MKSKSLYCTIQMASLGLKRPILHLTKNESGYINCPCSSIPASGDSVDATQELFTLGLCNMFGGFVSSMPVTGSFSRSAVNHASGVRTPIGGLYTGNLQNLKLLLSSHLQLFCVLDPSVKKLKYDRNN